jgi:predicted permease
MLQDLRLALRRVLRTRGFSLAVVLILAVGIGSTGTMVSVLNALSFKTLRLPDPHSLVGVMTVGKEKLRRPTPLTAIEQLRGSALPADGWCGISSVIEATEVRGRVMEAYGELMSGDCLAVLGVAPAMGRWFESAEAPLAGPGRPVMVITHRFWMRMFDGAPDVLGRTVRVQNIQAEVIGVMPQHFNGFVIEYAVDFVLPFNAHRQASGAQWFIGRLRDGATIDQLRTQLQAMWPSVLEAILPQTPTRPQLLAEGSGEVERFAGGFSVLRRLYATPVRNMAMLSAGLIFLVCVNVGGLLLARTSGRSPELAVMRALGASPLRLARPLFAEGLIYAAAGAALGVPLVYAGSVAFTTLLPWANLPWAIEMTPDLRILTGIVGGVFALAVGISMLPVWLATRRASLQHTDRTATRSTNRWGQALLVSQVAATVILVFTGGLVVRSFNALWSGNRGYQSDGVLSIRLVPNPGAYEKLDQPAYYASLMDRLGALPGVEAAGFARYFGTINNQMMPQPIAFVGAPESHTSGASEYISPGFFETLRIPLLRGRDITWNDLPSTPKVALVSESLARALAPGGDVVGRALRFGTDPATANLQIIGVVGNISVGNLRQTDVRLVYMPGVQAGLATYATVHLLASRDPMSLARQATDAIGAMGREHVQQIMPVDVLFSNSVVAERMATLAGAVAAALALMISCAGMFALLSHSVQKRTREIGIRVAIGATPAAVSKLVIRDALVLVMIGIAIGLPGAIAATSLVRSLLFGVTTTDGFTLATSAALLLATAMIGAALPTLRAIKVEPTVALRSE